MPLAPPPKLAPHPPAALHAPVRPSVALFDGALRTHSLLWERLPATRGAVKAAILAALRLAARTGSFTCLTRPVWSGWASAPSLLWRLPAELAERRFTASARDFEAGCFVADLCLELADERELERRLCCPLRHNPDPAVASRQDWEFRLPGFGGCCYWEPSRPEALTAADDWASLVNERHLALLRDSLGEDPSLVPLYVLARIERYRLQNTGRATPRRVLLM